MPETFTLSIIIPVHNEEKTIIPILKMVNKQKISTINFEIIVVDDGSTDDSLKILKENSELYSNLIILEKNMGKGGAVKVALKEATGEYILFQDADMEYDPNDYQKLFTPVQKLDADIVMGSRINAPTITRVHYYWNKVGNRFITFLFNVLNNTTFTDIYSGYILYRKNLLDSENLKTKGWEQQAEILSKIIKKANTIYEVPIAYYGRTYQEGKKIKPKHVLKIITTIIKEHF